MELTEYLREKGFKRFEGYSYECMEQVEYIRRLCVEYKIGSVLEIGFNAGHSSYLFLGLGEDVNVLSFDIGIHDYTVEGKKFIDDKFLGRHELIIGDSNVTVPVSFRGKKYDLIFIDGCHDYKVAKLDLENCKKYAHENTLVIMDDTVYTRGMGKTHTGGPTNVWLDALKLGLVEEFGMVEFGVGRGMSWGRYLVFDV